MNKKDEQKRVFLNPKKTHVYKSLDLFAGIGGIRMGFEKWGFKTVFSNDIDPYCKITYDANFKDAPLTVCDISKIKTEELVDFDICLAGFPCQPFSIAGYRRGFLDAERGNLFFEIVRILRDKKPEAVFLENVKNLKSHDNGRTFEIISDALNDLGYYTKSEILNSAKYGGVPHNRERVYIVGFRSKKNIDAFEFPSAVPLKKSIKDILETDVDEKYYYSNNSHIYSQLKEMIISENTVYQWRRKYVRENKSNVCPTLTANMGTGGHNVPLIKDANGIRKLTPRECARLQGFPDSFILPRILSDSRLYKQIGNSVTVTVIERIAEKIRLALDSYTQPNSDHIKKKMCNYA
ncbi:MAG: DNA cytosine methyltransferase [Candidatus Micrarchaeia archaeon]